MENVKTTSTDYHVKRDVKLMLKKSNQNKDIQPHHWNIITRGFIHPYTNECVIYVDVI